MAYGVKICLGCGGRGTWGRSGRCPECFDAHKAKYRDPAFIAERQRLQDLLRLGVLLDCARCGTPIVRIEDLDTGHQRQGVAPEHKWCNRGNGR